MEYIDMYISKENLDEDVINEFEEKLKYNNGMEYSFYEIIEMLKDIQHTPT